MNSINILGQLKINLQNERKEIIDLPFQQQNAKEMKKFDEIEMKIKGLIFAIEALKEYS